MTCAGQMINSGEVDQSEADMYFLKTAKPICSTLYRKAPH